VAQIPAAPRPAGTTKLKSNWADRIVITNPLRRIASAITVRLVDGFGNDACAMVEVTDGAHSSSVVAQIYIGR